MCFDWYIVVLIISMMGSGEILKMVHYELFTDTHSSCYCKLFCRSLPILNLFSGSSPDFNRTQRQRWGPPDASLEPSAPFSLQMEMDETDPKEKEWASKFHSALVRDLPPRRHLSHWLVLLPPLCTLQSLYPSSCSSGRCTWQRWVLNTHVQTLS